MFKNKLCVVTGAASGLGLAVTQSLSQQGARVFALDLQPTPDMPGVTYLNCNVADRDQWQAVVDELDDQGPIDFVHLNAGIQIAPPDAPMEDYQFANLQLDRYRKMMGVNVDGVVFGLHALVPHMHRGSGIVVTSSLAGITPYAIDPLYAMSKHAVSGLVRSLADTLAEAGITISALCPGGIDTAIIPEAQRAPKAVFMTPAHVAEEVLRLFDPDENGKTWAKVAESKPAFIVRAPGDRTERS